MNNNKLKCGFCGKEFELKDLRDELSIKEYKISQMCQECQDGVFY